MNVGEGLRRLGIVLGFVGGAIGVLPGYEGAWNLWNAHVTHKGFESLMASPTMSRIAKDVQEFKTKDQWQSDQVVTINALSADPNFLKLPDDEQKRILLRVKGWSDERDVMNVLVNLDGVKEVMVDKSGRVSSIELSTGESIPRTEQPRLTALLSLLVYPLGGFLALWGATRILAWLVAGFVSK
jgi:hypothetical protein